MKEFIIFWTYSANYAEKPYRVTAKTWQDAVKSHWYSDNDKVRFIVFEVGGDLVHDGIAPQPATTS